MFVDLQYLESERLQYLESERNGLMWNASW